MHAYLLLPALVLVAIGCGSSSESGPSPSPAQDAGGDQSADAPADSASEAEPDDAADAFMDTGDTGSDAGHDAGPATGELLLQGGARDRIVPHVAARMDGTAYLSWYALDTGNYSIRMQRLDTTGNKQWGDDGILASSVDSSSWVMDYDLAVDDQGNAILAYSNTTDFTLRVQRIDHTGAAAWGQGTVLTNSAQGTRALTPHVVIGSDGAVAIAWDESRNDATNHVVVQRIDASGQPVWATPFSIDPDGGQSPQFSQLIAGADGSVIVVWVENGGVNHPGDAYAQRIDDAGHAVWASKIKINGTAQLPFPMRPLIVPDGQGGLYAAWTALSGTTSFSGRIQHIAADGTAAWDAEGLAVADDSAMMQLPSAVAHVPGSSPLVVSWKRTDADQNYSGLTIQAFDATGAKLWSDPGLALVPADATEGALAGALRPTQ